MDKDDQKQYNWFRIFQLTIRHFFGGLSFFSDGITDPRDKNRIKYSLDAMLFAGLLLFFCRVGSRRQSNEKFRDNERIAAKFEHYFSVHDFPHGDTLNDLYSDLNWLEVQEIPTGMVEKLIRHKVLYPHRLFDQYYVIAVDGTGHLVFSERHCEHCLTKRLKNGKTIYYHHVLEAKLVTPTGFSFSLMTEFIENPIANESKQDCELKAFYRLADRLKARFPRLPICLSLDGLSACGPVFSRCEVNHWKYMIVFKEGSLPSVAEEFDSLCALSPEKQFCFQSGQGVKIKQDYEWVSDISYVDSKGQEHNLSVLQCLETEITTRGKEKVSKFKWLTNFQLPDSHFDRGAEGKIRNLAHHGGRIRWKIENEGFNVQKNGGYGLEHAYSMDENAGKIFYLLLQVAHIIHQLIEKGSLLKQAFPKKAWPGKEVAFRILEAWRNLRLTAADFLRMDSERVQIRFDTS